ncbi:succinyldiaminopimelate transaminase [Bordetella pertussis]|nr:succinyldiaminopimelate transaminase [Bordetella pertussis]
MNPRLDALHPYPFEKLRALLADAGKPTHDLPPINLSIGEPKHAAPACVGQAIAANLAGLSVYPSTKGEPALRQAISQWLSRRYSIPAPDPESEVLPVLGSREALFAFAQTVIDPSAGALVVCPNPFYQIYEGAALLAGATPYYVNADPARDFGCDWARARRGLAQDPTGVRVFAGQSRRQRDEPGRMAHPVRAVRSPWFRDRRVRVLLGNLSGRGYPPLGSLQAARRLGRDRYTNLVAFSSLSKRSNVPGMRSGFVAGDAALLARFLLYRTYHGSAMSPVVSAASIAAWSDETHVQENRRQYRAKFEAVLPILQNVLDVRAPQASFYLWAGTPGSDTAFARELYGRTGVTVLPGSLLAREAHNANPGQGRIRIALVAPLDQCVQAAERIAHFARTSI